MFRKQVPVIWTAPLLRARAERWPLTLAIPVAVSSQQHHSTATGTGTWGADAIMPVEAAANGAPQEGYDPFEVLRNANTVLLHNLRRDEVSPELQKQLTTTGIAPSSQAYFCDPYTNSYLGPQVGSRRWPQEPFLNCVCDSGGPCKHCRRQHGSSLLSGCIRRSKPVLPGMSAR